MTLCHLLSMRYPCVINALMHYHLISICLPCAIDTLLKCSRHVTYVLTICRRRCSAIYYPINVLSTRYSPPCMLSINCELNNPMLLRRDVRIRCRYRNAMESVHAINALLPSRCKLSMCHAYSINGTSLSDMIAIRWLVN